MRILRPWPTGIRVKTSGFTAWLPALLLLLFLPVKSSLAQSNYCTNPPANSKVGGFTLTNDRICIGSTVQIKAGSEQQGLANTAYVYEYDGKGLPNMFDPKKDHTYTQKGTFTILQVGTLNGFDAYACKTVTVLPLDPVSFKVQACLGRRVTVTVDPTTLGQYDSYTIRWGDGAVDNFSRAELQAQPPHTYSNSNPQPITIEGVYTNACSGPSANSTEPYTLLSSADAPAITALTTTSDKAIDITYQASTGVTVQLYQKIGGTYTATGQKGTDIGKFTIQTDAQKVQCFQLVTQDACNTTPLKSDEVCSLVLDVKAANKQNNLSWQPYAGSGTFRSYKFNRNNAPLPATLANQSTSSYSDANAIECGTQYCYQLVATITGTAQVIVTSNNACVTGINGELPGDVVDVLVTVEDGHPLLIATPPANIGPSDSFTMVVSRASGSSGNFQPIATLERKNRYTDESVNASSGSYCYQVTYKNSCGLESKPSTPVCTVFLTSKSATGIDWTAESPFTPETVDHYTIEVNNLASGVTDLIPIGSNTHYEPDPNDPNLQSQRYRIIATDNNGFESNSNYFTFRREAMILVPDAFTPNGDGMNDILLAKGIYVDQFVMNIYSRWGEVVYSTTDKTKGWDGTTNGQIAPAGQYMYRIEVIDLTGLKTVRTGAVLLIR